jgi:quaternary ammonium compound-resistance protein SugE
MSRTLVFLATAVVFEVLWAVMLKASNGFTVLWPSVATAIAYPLSAVFLGLACRQLDISVAYAVWTGSGAAGVAVLGVLVFHERLGVGRAVGFALVTCGVIVLVGLESPQTASPRKKAEAERALAEPIWDRAAWHPGLENAERLLGDVYETLPPRRRVPWHVRLLEDPALAPAGLADPFTRDCLHIALGRGLTTQDQAFVIGFGLGASRRCARWQQALFRFCARRLHDLPHRFSALDCQVFDFAVQAGRRLGKPSLARTAFHLQMHRRLGDVRQALGLDPAALYLVYDAERARWPRGAASRHLPRPIPLVFPPQVVTTRRYAIATTVFSRAVGSG